MSTNFNLFFYLKELKRYKSGPVPIYLRITIDCQRGHSGILHHAVPCALDQRVVLMYINFKYLNQQVSMVKV